MSKCRAAPLGMVAGFYFIGSVSKTPKEGRLFGCWPPQCNRRNRHTRKVACSGVGRPARATMNIGAMKPSIYTTTVSLRDHANGLRCTFEAGSIGQPGGPTALK